ncbi:hypothetical protein VP01_1015g4 [Puccinia sorghi]|uniref:Uncharacterized protein n=1 Tax=Puccinia sorghi TaxID=27349 RepID=A0A0L6VV96_9BASI|nr:hypothetical protein VP01_1015g4 [Puccinia sorghi]
MIDNDWNFNPSHLYLKLVTWFHQVKWLADQPLSNNLQKHGIGGLNSSP